MMFEDLRTPEARARDEAQAAEWARERNARKEAVERANREFAGRWSAIETMPFEAYAENYGLDATVLVTDGSEVAVTTIRKRFGRPVRQVKPPVMAMTDSGIAWVGGEYEEFDRPQWWFDWEITDELSSEDDRYGKDEIGFVPTHWQPMPLPPA